MKLVRDRIPEIIEETGGTCKYHTADLVEFRESLYEKQQEELAEFVETPNIEEAADMWEVLQSIFWAHDIDRHRVEQFANKKMEERGGFVKGIILESVGICSGNSSEG